MIFSYKDSYLVMMEQLYQRIKAIIPDDFTLTRDTNLLSINFPIVPRPLLIIEAEQGKFQVDFKCYYKSTYLFEFQEVIPYLQNLLENYLPVKRVYDYIADIPVALGTKVEIESYKYCFISIYLNQLEITIFYQRQKLTIKYSTGFSKSSTEQVADLTECRAKISAYLTKFIIDHPDLYCEYLQHEYFYYNFNGDNLYDPTIHANNFTETRLLKSVLDIVNQQTELLISAKDTKFLIDLANPGREIRDYWKSPSL